MIMKSNRGRGAEPKEQEQSALDKYMPLIILGGFFIGMQLLTAFLFWALGV
jgi:hypothetical protein